jgi:hypothetical protein
MLCGHSWMIKMQRLGSRNISAVVRVPRVPHVPPASLALRGTNGFQSHLIFSRGVVTQVRSSHERMMSTINMNTTDKIFENCTLGGSRSLLSRRTLSTTIDPEGAMRGTTSDTKMDGDEDDMEYRHPQLVRFPSPFHL